MASRPTLLRYVQNTNGGATVTNFREDWEPIGTHAWATLASAGFVREDEHGRIWLTLIGRTFLADYERIHGGPPVSGL